MIFAGAIGLMVVRCGAWPAAEGVAGLPWAVASRAAPRSRKCQFHSPAILKQIVSFYNITLVFY